MNKKIKILYNSRCSKCRLTMDLLTEKGIEAEVINYLETPPTNLQLTEIINLLSINPRDLIRKHEAPYKDLKLDNPKLSDQQLINAMIANPILIERPIIINGNKATIGRPPKKVLDIL